MTRETTTTLSPARVLELARRFFMSDLSVYSAWLEEESETHLTFSAFRSRIAVSAVPDPEDDGLTRVRVSTLRMDEVIGKFLTHVRTADSPKVREPGGSPA